MDRVTSLLRLLPNTFRAVDVPVTSSFTLTEMSWTMKEQMAAMMEAMMNVKKIMEANAVAIAATSVVAKVNLMSPSGINQMNHPT